MPKSHSHQSFNFGRAIRKLFLSGFLIMTFAAYVIHERLTNPDSALSPLPPTPVALATAAGVASIPNTPPPPADSPTLSPFPTLVPTKVAASTPQVLPSPTVVAQGQYKNGTYDGPTVDVIYGLVQVEAQVQNGQIASVKFLQYPNDRRTSVRINTIAMPYLQREAIQAQSAKVNIISGATLTSEGFMMSLNNALNTAHN